MYNLSYYMNFPMCERLQVIFYLCIQRYQNNSTVSLHVLLKNLKKKTPEILIHSPVPSLYKIN